MKANAKILVVDDESTACKYLEALLLKEDYRVEIAMDGAAGLAKAEAFLPDTILLDVMMPRCASACWIICSPMPSSTRRQDAPS